MLWVIRPQNGVRRKSARQLDRRRQQIEIGERRGRIRPHHQIEARGYREFALYRDEQPQCREATCRKGVDDGMHLDRQSLIATHEARISEAARRL